MKFKYPVLQEQLKRLDQRVQNLMSQFEMWSIANNLPEPIATHLFETDDEGEELFWRSELEKAMKKGEKVDEKVARVRAREVFSFHKVYCAIDLRDYIYTPEQYKKALEWLRAQVPVGMGDGEWEILGHDVGSGHHFHIGFRDMARYHAWKKDRK